MFWVECGDGEEPTPGETPEETPDGTSPDGETDEVPAADEEEPTPGPEAEPAEDEDADLAETGSSTPVVPLAAGAAALLGAGGYLALRRRNAARNG
ncbi:LPXTG cell wall anchor domain-containing protein [Streptomyces litchfieldiae]|uniref:LPXTG cell wall anchor domain-containing protein n=1 Tax=Streptomyces litchfieldiae TaxID=3075543 RepID=A0ABU2MZ99_9ACTN|nr:LPXTG cell wall anchor domain-containing protein [Streptomyces sp. DSM 44938]MDT0346971.1 LPXTG cell wall anchor domain-containing protein [Streptomyces sp. DSM 44938]